MDTETMAGIGVITWIVVLTYTIMNKKGGQDDDAIGCFVPVIISCCAMVLYALLTSSSAI